MRFVLGALIDKSAAIIAKTDDSCPLPSACERGEVLGMASRFPVSPRLRPAIIEQLPPPRRLARDFNFIFRGTVPRPDAHIVRIKSRAARLEDETGRGTTAVQIR
jgi:hypothetical protein